MRVNLSTKALTSIQRKKILFKTIAALKKKMNRHSKTHQQLSPWCKLPKN